MQNPMKKNIEKCFLRQKQNPIFILLVVVFLVLSARFLTNAQDAPAAPPEPPPAADTADAATPESEVTQTEPSPCEKEMPDFIAISQKEFSEFINTHFRSPLPTSQLIPVAIERYAQLRDELRAKLASYPPREGVSVGEADQQTSCKKLVDDGLKVPKMLLQQHIMTNAYAKKSTRLVDKYKEINGQLDKLNFTVAQMYGYFAGLSQQLPCYAKACKKQ